jgi:hypothetical protein
MKSLYFVILVALGTGQLLAAEERSFGGLEKEMDPATYEKSGLGTLTSDQRAVIDEFLRGYVAGEQKAAATTAAAKAVDQAVKERKVRPPDVFESKIVGRYTGYGPRTFFHLENGQVWRPTNDEVVKESPIENPTVVIYHDMLGYQMFVEGASHLHVRRVQ